MRGWHLHKNKKEDESKFPWDKTQMKIYLNSVKEMNKVGSMKGTPAILRNYIEADTEANSSSGWNLSSCTLRV